MVDGLRYRFTLENETLGSQVISEPIGWNDIKFNLMWSDRSNSKLFTLATPLRFYGKTSLQDGGMDYVLRAIRSVGVDSQVNLRIETTFNEVDYTLEYIGTLLLPDYKRSIGNKLNYIECPIQETSKNQILKSRFETKVDFSSTESLDGVSIIPLRTRDISLHSLPIFKEYQANTELAANINTYTLPSVKDQFVYFGVGFENISVDELETFGVGNYIIAEAPISILKANDNGLYEIDFNPDGQITLFTDDNQGVGQWSVKWCYRINSGPETELFTTNGDSNGPQEVDFTTSNTFSVDLTKGDDLFIYGKASVTTSGSLGQLGPRNQTYTLSVNPGSSIRISSNTTALESTLTAPLIHEVCRFISDSIFSEDVTFYSELLGNLSTQDWTYTENGCMSFLSVCNGRMLRGLSQNFSMSLKDITEALNCLTPIGWGIEIVNDKEVLRLEHASYFYNQDSILTITDIPEIRINNNKSKYYNKIKSGYSKWELEDVGGIKEPNSPREHNTILKRLGKTYDIRCKFITSGYIIETIRRLKEEATTDYKFDNDNFFISLNRSVNGNIPTGLNTAAKDESFSQVTGITDSEQAYNLDLLPEINLLRHGNMINSGLYSYPATKINPVYFEGFNEYSFTVSNDCPGNFNNQAFTAKNAFDWNYADNIDVNPLYLPIEIEFDYPLGIKMFRTLIDNVNRDANGALNRNKAITIRDHFNNEYKVFVINIKQNPLDPEATWECLLANADGLGISVQEVPSWLDMNGNFVIDDQTKYIGD